MNRTQIAACECTFSLSSHIPHSVCMQLNNRDKLRRCVSKVWWSQGSSKIEERNKQDIYTMRSELGFSDFRLLSKYLQIN